MTLSSNENRKKTTLKTALVLSRKTDKTAIVTIPRVREHSLYGKQVRRRSKFKVNDPNNEVQKGDVVLVAETRTLSSSKHWRLVKILKRATKVEEASV